MKKIVSLIICILLLIPLGVQGSSTGDDATNARTDTSVQLLTPDEFVAIFCGGESRSNNSNFAGIDEVSYSYLFAINKTDSNRANVTLSFSFAVASQEYPVQMCGDVYAYPLASGDVLWEGPLEGALVVGSLKMKVLAGFAKLSSSDRVQISVTIQSFDPKDAINPIMFSFGDDVISAEIHTELVGKKNDGLIAPIETLETRYVNDGGFVFGGAISRLFCDIPDAGWGQAAIAFINQNTNQIAITIKTFCGNIKRYYDQYSLIDVTSVVDSFKIEIAREAYDDSSFSWIDGIETHGFNPDNFGAGAVPIAALFSDSLSLLGVPTSTILVILDGVNGRVDEVSYSNLASVEVSFGLLQSADFDESSVGIPVIFQMDRMYNGLYIGDSAYTISTSIRYRSYVWYSTTNWPTYYYTDACDVNAIAHFTLG